MLMTFSFLTGYEIASFIFPIDGISRTQCTHNRSYTGNHVKMIIKAVCVCSCILCANMNKQSEPGNFQLNNPAKIALKIDLERNNTILIMACYRNTNVLVRRRMSAALCARNYNLCYAGELGNSVKDFSV